MRGERARGQIAARRGMKYNPDATPPPAQRVNADFSYLNLTAGGRIRSIIRQGDLEISKVLNLAD
jgi:hypothetical protein